MKTIKCKGKDGVEEKFIYKMEYNPYEETWIFRVFSTTVKTNEFFEFQVRKVNETTLKVVMMITHDDKAYSAKGIPERIIEEAHKVLRKKIISSTNSKEHRSFSNEYFTESAEKVWKRLEANGKAFWDEKNKVYYYKA